MRRLYVYYRVAERDVVAVVEALRSLRARRPFELLRRPAAAEAWVTLMEVHDDDALESEVAVLLAPWVCGERHIEVFEPLDPT